MTSTDRRWGEADRELVAEAIGRGREERHGSHLTADAVLDALAAAGRLADPMQQSGGEVIATWSALLDEAQAEAARAVKAAIMAAIADGSADDHDAQVRALVAEWNDPSGGTNPIYKRAVRDRLREQWPHLVDAIEAIARQHATTREET